MTGSVPDCNTKFAPPGSSWLLVLSPPDSPLEGSFQFLDSFRSSWLLPPGSSWLLLVLALPPGFPGSCWLQSTKSVVFLHDLCCLRRAEVQDFKCQDAFDGAPGKLPLEKR